jgi:aspartyl-tRNA(Asn)/glutamyl-tRNA(Gln) amidotransferase subunit B
MNSFRAVYRAMDYEAKRQRKAAEESERLVQETRGWVEESGITVSQRSKEYAHDYRYFPEPDLPPLTLSREWVEEIRSKLPELPEARRDRFVAEYGLPLYDASLLTSSKEMAEYEEEFVNEWVATDGPTTMTKPQVAKLGSKWLLGEVSRIMNAGNIDIIEFSSRVSPERLVNLTVLNSQGLINEATAKSVLEEMYKTGQDADSIITQQGLGQISDTDELKSMINQVVDDNPKALADLKAGKEQALKFLVGQVMKATRGRANPQLVNELLNRKLEV